MLLWLLLAAGAATAVVAASSSSESSGGGGAPAGPKIPEMSEPATGLDEIDSVIARADNFAKLLDEIRVGPEKADFEALAKVANAAKAAAEEKVKKDIDKTIDNAAAAAAAGAVATGVGIVAIPIIYLGAWAGKYAARAQLVLLKWMFGGGADGWNATWRGHAEGEAKGLSEAGIPFPQFSQKFHVSPMGYVNGGGGEKCGQGGLCGLRRNFSRAATNDAQGKDPAWQGSQDPTVADGARAAMLLVKKWLPKNPFAFALYVTSVAWQYDWTYGANTIAILKQQADFALDLLRKGASAPSDYSKVSSLGGEGFGPRPDWWPDTAFPWEKIVVARIRFWHMLVAAIATSVAQERGVTPALWTDMIGKGWEGWDKGIAEYNKWAPTRPKYGWWAPGSGAPWGIAFAYWHCQALADYILKDVKGGADTAVKDVLIVPILKRS